MQLLSLTLASKAECTVVASRLYTLYKMGERGTVKTVSWLSQEFTEFPKTVVVPEEHQAFLYAVTRKKLGKT